MKCFYHGDADGKCSGYWVAQRAQITDGYGEPDFIEMQYTTPFPLDSIRPDEQVYIVDYSISPDEMRKLLKITKDVTWIDHHKTAIEKYEGFEHEIRGVRRDGIAACMLTCCYLHEMTIGGRGEITPFDITMPLRHAPAFTRLIADWDVWRFEYGDSTRYFITAFNAYDFHPQSPEWERLYADFHKLIEQGEIMIRFRDGWAKEYMKLGFEVDFEGLKCFAVNLGHCNSEYFKSLPEGEYDVFMPFVFNGELYTVSLYSTAVDVSEIAKKYGGGGHRSASGFQCKELPFKK